MSNRGAIIPLDGGFSHIARRFYTPTLFCRCSAPQMGLQHSR